MRIFCIILASCLFLGTNIASVSAQSLEDLKSRIDGGDSKAVIEFAISAGAEGMPYLRTLLQRGEPQHRWGTTSGYAMAALAKLGDRAALDQIKGELSAKVTVYDAIAKLKFVGGHTAAGLLVDAFRHPELYEAMIQHEQDYTDDPLLDICKALIEVVPDPPISPSDPFSHIAAPHGSPGGIPTATRFQTLSHSMVSVIRLMCALFAESNGTKPVRCLNSGMSQVTARCRFSRV